MGAVEASRRSVTAGLARTAVVVLIAVASVPLGVPAQAATRSGTIVGGYYPFAPAFAPGPGPDCMTNVDCLPWVTARCPSEMAGLDPALHTSIVDVRSLARSKRVRTLSVEPVGRPAMFGGVSVQLWGASCNEIFQIGGDTASAIKYFASFRIAKGAVWMTIASVDTPPLRWTLK